jgi:hypothetical protein
MRDKNNKNENLYSIDGQRKMLLKVNKEAQYSADSKSG